jgi:hypothetical protein
MLLFARMAAALGTALLTACATTPPPQMPARTAIDAPYVVTRSELLDETSYMVMHLDDDRRIVYFQSSGGGGLAVGLLFGALGAVANMAMIESNTKADVARLKDRMRVDPLEVFQEVAGRSSIVSAPPGSSQLRITPYLYVVKINEGQLTLASALLVEQGTGAGKWSGRLMYQLPEIYTFEQAASLDGEGTAHLRASVAAGFRELLHHVSSREQLALPQDRAIHFKSHFLHPGVAFEYTGNLLLEAADHVWVATGGNVYALRKNSITITKRP